MLRRFKCYSQFQVSNKTIGLSVRSLLTNCTESLKSERRVSCPISAVLRNLESNLTHLAESFSWADSLRTQNNEQHNLSNRKGIQTNVLTVKYIKLLNNLIFVLSERIEYSNYNWVFFKFETCYFAISPYWDYIIRKNIPQEIRQDKPKQITWIHKLFQSC